MLDNELITITGYHGTEIKKVPVIIKDGFSFNTRNDHWLEQGFYLYSEFNLAKWWAEKKFKQNYDKPAVLKVEVSVSKVALLNLDTIEGLNTFFQELKPILDSSTYKVRFKDSEPIKNLCFALDILKEELNILVIMRTFLKDNPTYGAENIVAFENKYFALPRDFAYSETQICVSNNNCVTTKKCCYPYNRITWS